MPLYEYECSKCGNRFELIRKFSDPDVKKCPQCSGKVNQLVSSSAFHFKGSGWYVTDYAKKGGAPDAPESGEKAPEKAAEKSDGKEKEKKPKKEKETTPAKPKAS